MIDDMLVKLLCGLRGQNELGSEYSVRDKLKTLKKASLFVTIFFFPLNLLHLLQIFPSSSDTRATLHTS